MGILEIYAAIKHRAFCLKVLCEINQIPVQSIVEVGTWKGDTAKILRGLFPKAHLYLIDPWNPSPEYIREGGPCSINTEDYTLYYEKVSKFFEKDSQVSIIRKTSLEGALDVPDGIDLVFIDGDHSYKHVKQDIETWGKKVRKGGLLAGHDFASAFPGVMKAVEEVYKGKYIIGLDYVWATIA